jgi:hypothetical protein
MTSADHSGLDLDLRLNAPPFAIEKVSAAPHD